jgi:hypothetical protein
MALTIGNWIFIAIVFIIGAGIAAICIFAEDIPGLGFGILITTIVLCVILMVGLSWWHNNTANGQRAMKDYTSNMEGGLNREITITAEDGRLIYHYEGKVDVETRHDGNANYILFEGEDGLRRIIYYGVQDTVLIEEKRP